LTTDTPAWRTSSYSGGSGGDCVEVASVATAIMVRDTKERDGRTLAFSAGGWAAFTVSLKR